MRLFLLGSVSLLAFSWLAPAQAVVLERLEASVNSSTILLSDVTKFRDTEKLRTQLDPLFSGTSIATHGADAPTPEIVDFLIDERLIIQQYPVTDAEVEQEINSIQSNNHIDRGSLKKALVDQGFSFEDYFDLIRTSASKRNLIDRDIRTKVSISDDDVKNYFFNHDAKSAEAPKAYTLKMISVSIKNFKSVAAAKDTAQRAAKDLKSGELFDEVAKRFGDDSSVNDLGTMTEDQMSKDIRLEIKGLKIGDVSEIFGSEKSGAFYILKLLDVKSDETNRLEKMKEEIRSHLAASEYQHQIQLWLERQRQTAFIHRAGDPGVSGMTSPTPKTVGSDTPSGK